MPPYNCKDVCQAPDSFFSGLPVFTIPKNMILTLLPGNFIISVEVKLG
jgi:hypothetical protein